MTVDQLGRIRKEHKPGDLLNADPKGEFFAAAQKTLSQKLKAMETGQLDEIVKRTENDLELSVLNKAARVEVASRDCQGVLDLSRPGRHPSVMLMPVTADITDFDFGEDASALKSLRSADERELKKKYAVTYQHTFVQVDENEEEVTRWSGGEFEEILQRIK